MGKEQKEEWRPVVGWEPYYEVSNFGRVRRIQTGHVLKAQYTNKRYCVYFEVMGRRQGKTVARLVAEAFLPPPQDAGMYVYHRDLDPANNKVGNLYWLHPYFNEEAIANSTVSRRTPECRAKYAALQKRRMQDPVNYAKFIKARKVICVETGVVYPSEQDAAKEFGIAKTTVHSSCKNGTPQHWQLQRTGGNPVFHFRYYDPEEWKPKECIWKPVPVNAVAAKYEVSNMGEVRRISDKRPLVAVQDKRTKYCRVSFFVNGGVRGFCVHKLVADAFLPKQYGMDCVGHRDGDRSNNCVTNLYRTNIRSTYRSPINKANYAGGRKPRAVVCIETGAVYKSLAEASKACHITANSVTNSCERYAAGTALYKKHTTKGKPVYHFRYADQ